MFSGINVLIVVFIIDVVVVVVVVVVGVALDLFQLPYERLQRWKLFYV